MTTDASTTYESLIKDTGLITAGAKGEKEQVDPKVLEKLPEGTTVIDATGYGASFWTRTVRIQAKHADETEKTYFLKYAVGPESLIMMKGEFRSQSLLYHYAPDFIPEPVAWGTCSDNENHFFLCEFVEMTDDIPGPDKFCNQVAQLHLKSMEDHAEFNPESKFGFDILACQGNIVINNRFHDTWEECFTRGVEDMFISEEKTQGKWPEVEQYKRPFIEAVIPRLLRPLETDGNKIKPCLVHGDLWHGNTSVAVKNGNPYAFDACAQWAHNEYELGIWRATRYKFKRPYYRAYHNRVPVSAPEEDWDDRNALYAVRIDLLCSALYGTNRRFRELALEGIKMLVEKHAGDFNPDRSREGQIGGSQGMMRVGY